MIGHHEKHTHMPETHFVPPPRGLQKNLHHILADQGPRRAIESADSEEEELPSNAQAKGRVVRKRLSPYLIHGRQY